MKQEFLKSLKTKLEDLKLPKQEIIEVINDHEEMINQAIEAGLDENKIEDKFGKPEDIASALRSDYNEVDEDEIEQGYRLYKTFAPLNDELEIQTNLVNEAFSVIVSKVEQIELHVKKFDHEEKYDIKFESDKLVIRNKKSIFSGFKGSPKFKVYVPASLDLKSLNLKTVNGKVYVKGCNVLQTDIQSVNGNINVKKCNDHNTKITTVNGKINLSTFTTKELFLSFVSGNGIVKDVTVDGDVNIRSVSGDVSIKDFTCNKLNFNTVSGDLNGKETYPNSVSLRSVSGDIIFKNKKSDKKIDISKKKSLSGTVKIES